MNSPWPWLAVAALGALHGLSPANGWLLAAAWGLRARNAARARQALLPIGIGHLASVVLVALAFAQGVSMQPAHALRVAGAVLVGMALWRLRRARRPPTQGPAHSPVAVALSCFLMATAHGTGMMLVPALVPLCLADNPAREITASGSLLLALAAVGVHTAAMLLVTSVVASGICRAAARLPRLAASAWPGRAGTTALAAAGLFLLATG